MGLQHPSWVNWFIVDTVKHFHLKKHCLSSLIVWKAWVRSFPNWHRREGGRWRAFWWIIWNSHWPHSEGKVITPTLDLNLMFLISKIDVYILYLQSLTYFVFDFAACTLNIGNDVEWLDVNLGPFSEEVDYTSLNELNITGVRSAFCFHYASYFDI